MRKLPIWYAQYFNRKHQRKGQLFENRYKSILCDEDNYLLAFIRYIHLNPIRAKIIQTMTELESGSRRSMVGRTRAEIARHLGAATSSITLGRSAKAQKQVRRKVSNNVPKNKWIIGEEN